MAYQLDSLIIGIILPVAQVAPYSVALNTSNFTRSLSTQGSALLLPTYSHFDAVADRKRQSRYFMNGVMACLVLAVPIIMSLAAFGEPILKLWLGSVPPKTYEIMIAAGHRQRAAAARATSASCSSPESGATGSSSDWRSSGRW